ncbi:MAG: type VI secretion system protein TssA [Candidatus Contendobacter sp.]|nr:type VI secretion system protein TssA [Candidatus Contendobacter sp.]MDS4057119.1 type VI secretion system protein TssA [Candidatus Contendobacter sp.]
MSVIDIEELLSEIAAAAPCGEDLEYDPAFAEMEELAQETPERQYGDTIIPAEPPDWRGVRKTALTLFERTRDLRVAVYLTRALLHVDGLAGFADGLALVDGLIERYWDTVYPQLDPEDDNDPTLRINTIVALCDPEATLRVLREAPLISSRVLGRFSLRDVQIAAGVLTPVATDDQAELPTQAKIDGAFQEVGPENAQAVAVVVAEAMARVERIEARLTDQIGVTQAPDLSALTGVLKEIRQALAEQLQRQGAGLADEAPAAEATDMGLSEGGGGGGQRLVVGEIASRDEVIRMLDKICEYFNRYEPSSPVPFLLKRARNLVAKDFMAILNDLAPGGTEQVNLIFGIQGENSD